MKKILLIIICLLLLPIGVFAKECDTSKIAIKSVTQTNKSNDVTELEEATFKDKTIGVNLSFVNVKDYIEYRLVVKNDSDEDYEFDKNSVALNLDYMEYSLTSEDSSNIIKSGQEKTLLLRVQYKTAVDPDKYINGKYQEDKNLGMNLSNRESVSNPKTSTYVIIVLLVVGLLLIGSVIVLKGSTRTKLLSLLLVLSLIPITTLAICKCELKVDSHIEIEQKNQFCVYNGFRGAENDVDYYEYQQGDTIKSLLERDDSMYDVLHLSPDLPFDAECARNFLVFGTIEELEDNMESLEPLDENAKIRNHNQGCYYGTNGDHCVG